MTVNFSIPGSGRALLSQAATVVIGALPDADSTVPSAKAQEDGLSLKEAAVLLSPLNGQHPLQPAQIPALYLQALNAVIAQEAVRQNVVPNVVADQLRDSVQRYPLWQGRAEQPGLRLQANAAFANLYVTQVLAPQLRQLAEKHGLAAGALADYEEKAREAIMLKLQNSSAPLAKLPDSIADFVRQIDQALQASPTPDDDTSGSLGSAPQTAGTTTRELPVKPHETAVSSRKSASASPAAVSADVSSALSPVPVTPHLQILVPGVSYRLPLDGGIIQVYTLAYFFLFRLAGVKEPEDGRVYQISLYGQSGDVLGIVQLYFRGGELANGGSILSGPDGELEMDPKWVSSVGQFSKYLNQLGAQLGAQEIHISVNTSVPAQPPTLAEVQALKNKVFEVLVETRKPPYGKFNTLLRTPFFTWLAYPEVHDYFSGEFVASLSSEQLKNWQCVVNYYTEASLWPSIPDDHARNLYSTAYFMGLEYAIRLRLLPGTSSATEIIETIKKHQNDPSFQGPFALQSVPSFMPAARQVDEVLQFLNALATPGLIYRTAQTFKTDSRFQALMDASPTWALSDFDDAVRATAFFKRFPNLAGQIPLVPGTRYRLDLSDVDWPNSAENSTPGESGLSKLDLEGMPVTLSANTSVGIQLDTGYIDRHLPALAQTPDIQVLQQQVRNNPGLLLDQRYQMALRHRLQNFEQTVDGLRELGLADNPERLVHADLSVLDKNETDQSVGPFIGGKMGQQPDHELNALFDPNNINKRGNAAVPMPAMIPGQALKPRENLEYANTGNTTLPDVEALFDGQNPGADQSGTGRTPQEGETLFRFLQRNGAVFTSPLGTEGQWSVLPSPRERPVAPSASSKMLTRATLPAPALQRLQRLAPLQREPALLQAAADVRAGRPTANAKLLTELIGTAAGLTTVLRRGWGDALLKVLRQRGNSQLLLRYRTADLAAAAHHPLAARFSLQVRQVLAQRGKVAPVLVRLPTPSNVLFTQSQPQPRRSRLIKPAVHKPMWLTRSQAPLRITVAKPALTAKNLQDIQAQWRQIKALQGQKNLPQLQAQLKALHQSLQSLQVQLQRQVNALPNVAQQAGQVWLSQTQAAVQQFAQLINDEKILHDIAYGAGVIAIGVWWVGDFVVGTVVNVWTGLGKLTGLGEGTI